MTRYRFIETEKANYPITLLCRVLEVARSGYYAWHARGVATRQQVDQQLCAQITAIYQASRATYGAPRVHAELRAQGVRCGRKRVARLMRQAGLVGCHRRRRRRLTRADPHAVAAPDLVARRFQATAPNQLWVADLTYVATAEGWLYLAFILDVFSRRIVGWAMAEHARAELVVSALNLALARRRPAAGLIHHSDQGSQYTALDVRQRLRAAGLVSSMGAVGDAYDNAMAEAFVATLKTELLGRRPWLTRQAARTAIFEYIEAWYNPCRRHSALDYLSPIDYEERSALSAAA